MLASIFKKRIKAQRGAAAAEKGHFDVLKWLRSQDPLAPWDEDVCVHAARRGDFHILQWARSQDPPAPWDEDVCAHAARRGDITVLEWARSQDPPAPWDERVCLEAARGGHVAILECARSQDPPAPWDERVFTEADSMPRAAIRPRVLDWLRSQNLSQQDLPRFYELPTNALDCDWVCSTCTFVNEPQMLSCEMCDTIRSNVQDFV